MTVINLVIKSEFQSQTIWSREKQKVNVIYPKWLYTRRQLNTLILWPTGHLNVPTRKQRTSDVIHVHVCIIMIACKQTRRINITEIRAVDQFAFTAPTQAYQLLRE